MTVANKPRPHTGSFVTHRHKIIAKLRYAMGIPIGYQDAAGFHFGAKLTDANMQALITSERLLKD